MTRRGADARRLLHEPRGPQPALRVGADAPGAAPRRLVGPDDALPVDRRAHARARRRARRVLPRHREPARHQARAERHGRPGASPHRRAQPDERAGQARARDAHGRRARRRRAAGARRGGQARGAHRALGVRPDARQHAGRPLGPEDARLRRHPARGGDDVRRARRVRHAPRRRALRADGRGRHRVHRRSRRASRSTTSTSNYASACDPRLNYRQALEMGFRIAKRLAKHGQR